jgi:hypothetical protein
MRKIEIIETELIIVKQALDEYKEKLQRDNIRSYKFESESIDLIFKKIRDELIGKPAI